MKFIKTIDFLGNEPKTFLFKKDLYQTYLGGFFSIITSLATCALCLYFIIIAIKRQDVNLITSQTTRFNKTLDLNNIPFLFYPANYKGVLYNSSVLYPVFQYWDYSAENKGNAKIANLPVKQCDASDIAGYEELFKNIPNLSDYYCMNRTGVNMTLFGEYGDITNGYSKIHIYVGKCKNDSIYNINPGRKGCLSQETIDAMLTVLPIHFYLSFPDYEIDFQNVTDPYIPYIKTEDFVMSYLAMNTYFYYFRRTFVTSDFGVVFEDPQTLTKYQFDLNIPTTLIGSAFSVTEGYGMIAIALSSRADIHSRSYMKLQDLIANIGGIVNLIYLFGKFLTNYVTDKSLLLEYINYRLSDYKSDGSNVSNENNQNNLNNPNKISDNNTIGMNSNIRINNFTQLMPQK
jgi:hypothetical protein